MFAYYVAQRIEFEPISGCLGEKFANYVSLEMMPFKMPKKKIFPVFSFVQPLQTSSKTNAREYTIAKLKASATTV